MKVIETKPIWRKYEINAHLIKTVIFYKYGSLICFEIFPDMAESFKFRENVRQSYREEV